MSIAEIQAENLTVTVGDRVLIRDLDVHARAGQVIGVTGPSGSGKTTLLHALGGLQPPAGGRLLIDGRPTVPWRDASTGLILQNLVLMPVLTAEETVALPLLARNLPRTEVAERAATALAALGLSDHANQLVANLSGGQRQRVAIARPLAARPDLVLADEPTSSLDPHWRAVVIGLLLAEAERGSVVVIASSDREITSVCTALITLS